MKIDPNDPNVLAQAAAVQSAQQANLQKSQQTTREAPSHSPAPDNQVTDKVSIRVEVPRKTLETLQQFGQLGEFLNTLATNLRKTKEGLESSAEMVDQMKGPLNQIIKQFPPYGPESQERMELLMTYNGLQKEIKALMVPPPPPPIYEKVQHLWQGLFSDRDGTISAPQLPIDAPDSHVKIAAAQLDSLSEQIGVMSEELSNSVKAI
jgi:hypothetical protein